MSGDGAGSHLATAIRFSLAASGEPLVSHAALPVPPAAFPEMFFVASVL